METTPDYQNDPPLRALRTFEAFARLDTVTAAARELGITASAVSHQLRLLEEFLQTPLTERQGRKLVLTEAGGEYYRAIRSAFTLLRGATGQVLDSASTRQITLSVIPLFGLGWLVPRLPSFLAAHPGLDLNILYAHHRNYLSDAADLSVRFGSGQWRGYRSTRLLPGAAVPVCSQEFLDRHGPLSGPGALAGLPLLHDEDRGTWGLWLSQAGVTHHARPTGLLFEDGLLTLAAARAGLGCALLREPLIRDELASGALVKLFDQSCDDGRDYYLCSRADSFLSEDARLLSAWLEKEAAASQQTANGGHGPV
ncbi:LysR substrate-binding domain-containing protein [Microvirgula aerodenitrificans]|uniref:LysR substrate-binding domain-containing protein n=1 Tax=Microvirgula aerodenitrificans TaxID=57480 RepID=UPI00248ED4C7|nr:LysR substrate-binding domain-containing protein [Microvirgula aerodenitrificans]